MPHFTFDLRQPGSHYLLATIRVETLEADGQRGSGTAFFFRYGYPSPSPRVYLITNNHVIEDAQQIRMRFHVEGGSEPWNFSTSGDAWAVLQDPRTHWVSHPDPAVDLCALPLTRLRELCPGTENIYFTSLAETELVDDDVHSRMPSLMEVAMIGYPNGLWDEQNNLPVQRRGVTATHPSVDFNGNAEVLVDIACFPGSSGSPVVYHDHDYFASLPRFLGVLHAGPIYTANGEVVQTKIPTKVGAAVQVQTMMHLGYVIKARKVVELIQFVERGDA